MDKEEVMNRLRAGLLRGLDLVEVKQKLLLHGACDCDISEAISSDEIRKILEQKNLESGKKFDNLIEGWDN